jgi:endonuclease YncB( thermonuclease family)
VIPGHRKRAAFVSKLDGLMAALVLIGLVATAAHLLRDQEVVSGGAQVIDGDSLRLDGREIRLSGIDAPELRQSCRRGGQAYPCGEVARRALGDMLAGRIVTCRLDGRDRYGRDLASCEAGTADVGATLVRRGHAVGYRRYEREEAAARRDRLELWAGSFERPSDWRRAHAEGRG